MSPSQEVMRVGLQAYVNRINAGDVEGVCALFAPDAVIEDPVGSPPKTGEEIRQWFGEAVALGARITPVASIRGSHGREAALAFEVHFTPPGGERLCIRSLDVCSFDDAGRITHLRGYWGPDDVGPA
jgi:steroid delta-isomerase